MVGSVGLNCNLTTIEGMYTGFGLGYGPIVFILQGELLPADMRSWGCGLLGILDNISLFLAVKELFRYQLILLWNVICTSSPHISMPELS